MKSKVLFALFLGFVGVAVCVTLRRPQKPAPRNVATNAEISASVPVAPPNFAPVANTNTAVARTIGGAPMSNLKTRFAEFSDAEKEEFRSNFIARYKPALSNWNNAFSGHVPLPIADVTLDNFAERVGRTAAYREYIFVVNGITLGVQDTKGVARVDYLNDATQTRKMQQVPSGGQAPVIAPVVSRDEVMAMLAAEGGVQFKPSDIRMTPTGVSGALNGGTIVNVGGDPDNAASFEYGMVFGSDAKLTFYIKPNH